MSTQSLKRIAPYVVVLGVAVFLYVVAGRIEYAARPGHIGPNFWPKAVLGVAMAACLYEIIKVLVFAPGRGGAAAGTVDRAAAPSPPAKHTGLLLVGMAITVGYVALIGVLGFILCTLFYLAAFMYLGRYRRLGVIATSSFIGTAALVLIFMKFVYVSLPPGVGHFGALTNAILKFIGI